jgi:metallophosphoesterase (TIGR00282 family)
MKILALGDIVGRPGRQAVIQLLPGVVKELGIDFVIANGENAAAGSGITPKIFQSLREAGVGCVTLGDHFHKRAEILKTLDDSARILRPANLSTRGHGKPFHVVPAIVDGREIKVGVFAVSGRLFMSSLPAGDPFEAIDRVLATMPKDVKVIVCDIHAEATSEKQAIGWYLAGRTSLAFGTHTHIPTADAKILNGHTGYITDVGMCGPYDSVLGRRKDAVLSWMAKQVPKHFEVATNDVRLCGVLCDIDATTGKATAIDRFERPLPGTQAAYDMDDKRA